MHTKINPANPHGCNRGGFAWNYVSEGKVAQLDFDCLDGTFLSTLNDEKIR